jgi:tRNA A-37 threonylcarbamoyl transferase component Bud32
VDLSESGRNPVEELAEEFIERRRRGETPTLEEYASKFPDLADEIRSLFPALMMMEKLGADPGGTDALDEPALGRAMSSSVGRARSSSHLQHLGDFRILREVGRGGMGIVYEAEQESLGRRVALKVLGGHRVLDRGQVRRFEGEARSAARLHHTNIVPVFGVGEQDGTHYYVMQFIQGQALDEVLAELKRLRAVGPAESTARAEITAGQAFEPDVQASNSERSSQAGNPNRHVAESLLSGEFHVAGQADDARPVGEWDGLPRPSLPEDGLGRPSHGVLTDNSERDPLGDSSVTLHGRSELSTTGQSDRQYARSVARIGIQVADALEYANAQGILHRDIKPSNLLLDLTGTAWVTDFGLAKASDGDDLTHTGDVVGTLRYMAPERCLR